MTPKQGLTKMAFGLIDLVWTTINLSEIDYQNKIIYILDKKNFGKHSPKEALLSYCITLLIAYSIVSILE